MFRIFHPDLIEKSIISVTGDDHRHIFKSLRLKTGDQLELGDGKGKIAFGTIREIDKKECKVYLDHIRYLDRNYPKITLAFSILKSDTRMEWLIEKAVELNVSKLVPLLCKRTEKKRIKKERIIKIAQSAFKQSLNPYLCEIEDPVPFDFFINESSVSSIFIAACEGERTPIAEITPSDSTILLIGPEGDFTAEEITFAKENGAKPIILGSMRLRSETAAIASLAYLRLLQSK